MATGVPRSKLALRYAKAAQEYLRSLPLEHFMEAQKQGTQRKITLACLELVHALWAAFQVFNEMLVQYPWRGRKKPVGVVPDNMVVVHEEEIDADGSYDVPLQPARPFWVLEYVSKYNKRKDYEDNMEKYERQLKVPYYLLFYPDNQEMTLYHHNGRKYVSVKPNEQGRCALPELEMEVALLDGWVRFWFRGELLPLPADLQREVDQLKQQLAEAQRDAREAKRQAREAERSRQEAERSRQEAERQREEERQARLAAEEELARLRAQQQQPGKRPRNSTK
jgi:hypothetical protein